MAVSVASPFAPSTGDEALPTAQVKSAIIPGGAPGRGATELREVVDDARSHREDAAARWHLFFFVSVSRRSESETGRDRGARKGLWRSCLDMRADDDGDDDAYRASVGGRLRLVAAAITPTRT